MFITGAAGTGKSFLVKYIVQELQKLHPNQVAITAPTGLAAINIGGQTIHSFAGVGLVEPGTPDAFGVMLGRVLRSEKTASRWRETRVLVVDEVSMLEPALFEALERIGRQVRNNNARAFGGLQLLFCGDFLQLPPVEASRAGGSGRATFCFETAAWSMCALDRGTVILRESVRQAGDPTFVQLLNEVRAGRCSAQAAQVLSNCCLSAKPLPADGIVPTKLYCTNRDVDAENALRLAELPGDVVSYPCEDIFGTEADKRKLLELLGRQAPADLRLKVAAQVVLLRNMPCYGLVNGSRGTVSDFSEKGVSVKFDSGQLLQVERESFYVKSGERSEARRLQVPLRLAWALTIHKAQGMTLTRAEVQLRDCFSEGQAYVALSRLRGLDGLWIGGHGVSPTRIRAHPAALRFYGLSR
eukprot:TRINITY_DN33953_c0_g1_i1.p1 TRINITY_DN33953_c0_g1~~TRINITY_DN33953_c0_g1_i1.p1  ORF type:complete len:413 (-),score=88.10 TRINITY_DN33953_c0_g1_i1:25-1263(-)